jgi:hypothetical protein
MEYVGAFLALGESIGRPELLTIVRLDQNSRPKTLFPPAQKKPRR